MCGLIARLVSLPPAKLLGLQWCKDVLYRDWESHSASEICRTASLLHNNVWMHYSSKGETCKNRFLSSPDH